MQWSTETIEKVICFAKNARFYLMCRQPNLHELARKLMLETCASFLSKFLAQVS